MKYIVEWNNNECEFTTIEEAIEFARAQLEPFDLDALFDYATNNTTNPIVRIYKDGKLLVEYE